MSSATPYLSRVVSSPGQTQPVGDSCSLWRVEAHARWPLAARDSRGVRRCSASSCRHSRVWKVQVMSRPTSRFATLPDTGSRTVLHTTTRSTATAPHLHRLPSPTDASPSRSPALAHCPASHQPHLPHLHHRQPPKHSPSLLQLSFADSRRGSAGRPRSGLQERPESGQRTTRTLNGPATSDMPATRT